MRGAESEAAWFLRLGHVLPAARDPRLSSRDVDAWRCERCDVTLRVSANGSWLDAPGEDGDGKNGRCPGA